MGVFTMFCCVCGGPAFNLGDWVECRTEPENPENNPSQFDIENRLEDFNLTSEEGKWLNTVFVLNTFDKGNISKEGSCDDYGRVTMLENEEKESNEDEDSDDDNGYVVCPLNFALDEKHGIFVHTVCHKLLCDFFQEKLTNLEYYQYFAKEVDDLKSTCRYNYFGIEKNWGQDYNIVDGEARFVKYPKLDEKIFENKLVLEELQTELKESEVDNLGFLAKLPFEIINDEIFHFFGKKELCCYSSISKYFFVQCSDNKYWRGLFERDILPIKSVEKRDLIKNWKKFYEISSKNEHVANLRRIKNIITKEMYPDYVRKKKKEKFGEDVTCPVCKGYTDVKNEWRVRKCPGCSRMYHYGYYKVPGSVNEGMALGGQNYCGWDCCDVCMRKAMKNVKWK